MLAKPRNLGLLLCVVAGLEFLVLPAVSGYAETAEEPRSSHEQVERKRLPKINSERLLAEGQARGKVPQQQGQPAIEIGKVNQGYRGLGQAGIWPGHNELGCETNAACSTGTPWADQISAVGLIQVGTGGVGSELCTGTMLNDTKGFKTYFLTASHCFGPDPDTYVNNGGKITVYWNYQAAPSSACSDHTVGAGTFATVTNYKLLAHWANTDFLLLQLTDPLPSGVRFAGWDATGATPPAPVVGIHQPQGDAKAISFAPTPVSFSGVCSSSITNPSPPIYNWLVNWNSGVTEPGSSGSCLFDANHRCIGQLFDGGNTASTCQASYQPTICTPNQYYAWYGMLSASWFGGGTRKMNTACGTADKKCCTDCLSDWLNPTQTTSTDNCDSGSTSSKCDNGDPHITTASGVHYDFQGAGEYVSLRNASGLEIQTRQAALPTAPPAADGYDGLDTCVSLNTAVAARVGKHRVTYEPKLSGEPDRRGFQPNPGGWPNPSDLQLRVDGELTTLGPAGLDLSGGGRIANTTDAGGLEIDFPDHNALYVTPGFYFQPYLFVHVVRLPIMDAADGAVPAAVSVPPESGLMGTVPKDSWLPALPDGHSVGPMPDSLHERYTTLYQNFGEKWRVKDKDSSLFDYAKGESPDTFWNPKWPPEHPPCDIPGIITPQPVSEPVAKEACRQITGKNTLHDCIFDVGVTGNLGFAQTYLAQQQLQLGATATTVKGDTYITRYGQSVTFTATVVSAVSNSRPIKTGSVQFTLDGSNPGSPLTLDSNGQAAWSTSDLTAGDHRVAASYIPSTNSAYLASVSPYETHVVLETFNWYLWLAILLLIIVLIFVIWWYLR